MDGGVHLRCEWVVGEKNEFKVSEYLPNKALYTKPLFFLDNRYMIGITKPFV